MRKLYLAALLALLATLAVVFFPSAAQAVNPSCTELSINGAGPQNQSVYVGSGTILGNVFLCDSGTYTYQWERDGTNISGATGTTYTTSSSDAGHAITLTAKACLNINNCTTMNSADSADGWGTVNGLGASKLSDEFNGASGTHPSSSTWTGRTDTTNAVTFNGLNSINESGTGFAALNAQYSDQDGDGDATSSADTDNGSEPGNNETPGNGDWLSSFMQSSAMTGARYAETRMFYPCTDNDTGWTNYGWEFGSWEGAGYGSAKTDEIDIAGARSKTSWGGTGNADYVLSPTLQTWEGSGSFDGDNDGDSVASETDGTISNPDGDADDPDADDSYSETSTGRGDNYTVQGPTTVSSSTDKQGSKVCGTWHTYGALIQAHSVTYYFDGKVNYTAYTNSTYGTPALGISSTEDLTTRSMKQVFSVTAYQAPPQSTANTYLDVDYIHVNALS